MQNLISAISKSKIGKLPQMGLRLVNKLQRGPTSDKFWATYIDHLSKPENYKKLSPHSKCLLSSVVTKFSRDLFRETNSQELLKAIYSDTINRKCISLLNLELLNMILVSSYTLRIPLSAEQLELILNNINEHMNSSNILKGPTKSQILEEIKNSPQGVDVFVSAVYSLAILSKTFPEHLKKISQSETIRTVMSKLEVLLELANGRETSLLLFSFDKLKIFNSRNVRIFEKYIRKMIEDMDRQALTTVFYVSSNNPNLKELNQVVKPKIDSVLSVENSNRNHETSENLTGRESCNILCSMIRSNTFRDHHYRLLLKKMPEMNLQEVCNVSSLLLSTKYKVDQEFPKVFINKIANAELSNMVVLDALTIVHFLYQLGIDNELILDRVVESLATNRNFVFNDKSVLLLHYLVLKNYRDLKALLECFRRNFNPRKLKPSQLILFYNSLITIKNWESENRQEETRDSLLEPIEELIYKVEIEIENFKMEELKRMDLFTLAKSSNKDILENLINHLSTQTEEYLDIFLNLAMCNKDLSVTRRINYIIRDLDIEKFFTPNNSDHTLHPSNDWDKGGQKDKASVKLGHLLNILVELKNCDILRYILSIANSKGVNFETALQILVSCKKLSLLDEDVVSLMERSVKSFETFSTGKMVKSYDGSTSRLSTRYENQTRAADLLGVLYHLDHGSHSQNFDPLLTDLLVRFPINDLYGNNNTKGLSESSFLNPNLRSNINLGSFEKARLSSNTLSNLSSFKFQNLSSLSKKKINLNNPLSSKSFENSNLKLSSNLNPTIVKCTLEQRSSRQVSFDEKELFDSLVFSLSNLCFNAVVSSSVLVRFVRYYLSRWHDHSPILLKCLSTNLAILPQFSLIELTKLNSLEFEEKTRYKREENEVHTSVFAVLGKMGFRPGAERQIMDYQVDILIT